VLAFLSVVWLADCSPWVLHGDHSTTCLGAGIVVLIAILAFLTMLETAYERVIEGPESSLLEHEGDFERQLADSHLDRICLGNGLNALNIPPKKPFRQNLSFSMPIRTKEPFLKIAVRPILSISTLVYYFGWTLYRNSCRSYSLASY
jgi:hypothetical protein